MTGRDHRNTMGAADAVPGQGGRRAESAASSQEDAVLHADGRDISPRKLALRFEAGAWELLSADADQWEQQSAYRDSPLPGALRQLMQGRTRWEGTATQLVEAVGEFSPELADIEPREAAGQLRTIEKALATEMGLQVHRATVKGSRRLRITKADMLKE